VFQFAATADAEMDGGESVSLGFGPLPFGVTSGGSAQVFLTDSVVAPVLQAAMEVDVTCADNLCEAEAGVPVRFSDASAGAVTSRLWDFGDGTGSTASAVEHIWSAGGSYTVTLEVSDGFSSSLVSMVFRVKAGGCGGGEDETSTACLLEGRYAVAVDWWNRAGESGGGQVALAGTDDSALFWFFDDANWEVLVKVLDGCSANGHVWVFGASTTDVGYRITVTDRSSGETRTYENEVGSPSPAIADTSAFSSGCSSSPVSSGSSSAIAVETAGEMVWSSVADSSPLWSEDAVCTTDSDSHCLLGGRYEVTVEWSTRAGRTGAGRAVWSRTPDSGLFWFFEPGNWEMMVKVLDGCWFNDRHWVLAASATDVGLGLRVRDTVTGAVKVYSKAPGKPAPAIVDVGAFTGICTKP